MSTITIGRRVAALLATASCLAVTACGGAESREANTADFDPAVFPSSTFSGLEGTMTWYDVSGGLTTEAKDQTVWKNFTELTGVPTQAEYTDGTMTKFRAAAEGGRVPWNLIEFGTGGEYFQSARAGLLSEIDTSVVPVDKLDPASVDTHGIRVEDNGAVLVWNTNALNGKTPTSATDLFNTTDFPGKRCIMKYAVSGGTLELALRADGVPVEDIYPLDVDRALAKLDTIKSDIVWWDSGSTAVQLLANGECAMGILWTGRIYDAIVKQNLPLDFTWNGGLTTYAYFAVPKDAPNPKTGFAAMAMWILDREGQIGFVDRSTYTTAIEGLGIPDYAPEVQPYLATGVNVTDAITEDSQYYADNLDAVTAALTEFQAQ